MTPQMCRGCRVDRKLAALSQVWRWIRISFSSLFAYHCFRKAPPPPSDVFFSIKCVMPLSTVPLPLFLMSYFPFSLFHAMSCLATSKQAAPSPLFIKAPSSPMPRLSVSQFGRERGPNQNFSRVKALKLPNRKRKKLVYSA